MNRIGDTIERTREVTIVKVRACETAYEVLLDGAYLESATSVVQATRLVKEHARANGLAGAGVTEAFGRNRQFLITPRYAFKKI